MRRDAWRPVLAVGVAAALLACGHDDGAARARLLESPAARQLVGAWDVTFRVEVATAVAVHPRNTPPITGTLVFAEDRDGHASSDDVGHPTHDGVYDVDFDPFGFSSHAAGEVPEALARVTETAVGDSLYVVLSPGTTRIAVQMAGRLTADSAAGVWHASTFSSGGGAGSFTMRRHDAP
jgi:hypothetical protein